MVDLREIGLSLSYEQNNDAARIINIRPGIAFQIIKCSPNVLGNHVVTFQLRNVKPRRLIGVSLRRRGGLLMVLLKLCCRGDRGGI